MKKISIFIISVLMGMMLMTGCKATNTSDADVKTETEDQGSAEVTQRDVRELELYLSKVENGQIPSGNPVDQDYEQMFLKDYGKLMRD